MAMVSRCLSVSTSFMLAALRVLHVDTSHRGQERCGTAPPCRRRRPGERPPAPLTVYSPGALRVGVTWGGRRRSP